MVTGACMLVSRLAFERCGGFDTAYVNGLEDVDLCLRLGEPGGEVQLCHKSVLRTSSRCRGARTDWSAATRASTRALAGSRPPDDLVTTSRTGC